MEVDSLSKHELAYHPGLMETEEVNEGISTFHYETIQRIHKSLILYKIKQEQVLGEHKR